MSSLGCLGPIIEARRRRIDGEKGRLPLAELERLLPPLRPPRDWASEVLDSSGFLIAEIKRASPSRGALAEGVDVRARAALYEASGAGAVSVLCEPDFFKGSREDVRSAAGAVSIPVLCKDFVLDPYQILQARQDGAAWILLIARVAGPQLKALVRRARENGIEPLVEAHSEGELAAAVEAGASLVGVNNRDLDTFEVDLSLTERLAPLAPPGCAIIAESGLKSEEELLRLRSAGARGFLIGEALMRSPDPGALLRSFRRALEGAQ